MRPSRFSPVFIIGHIRIGSVEGASCINMGNNWPSGFESHKKHNQGFGEINGDHNAIRDTGAVLHDSDFMDMFSPTDDSIPDWLRHLIPTEPETAAASKASGGAQAEPRRQG